MSDFEKKRIKAERKSMYVYAMIKSKSNSDYQSLKQEIRYRLYKMMVALIHERFEK